MKKAKLNQNSFLNQNAGKCISKGVILKRLQGTSRPADP